MNSVTRVSEDGLVQETEKVVGICGLYCGTCPVFLAVRENDAEELKKISKSRSLPIKEVRCDGCLSDRVFEPCIDCHHSFRQCANEKKVTWCYECTDFPCQRLKEFKDIHVVNGVHHHKKVIENLQNIKKNGIERFVEEQEKKGKCPQCGKRLYWYLRECPICHIRVEPI